MSKFLVLNFRNAKLFRNGSGCKDFIFDLTHQRKRKGEPQFVEPITVYQISNVLHVLFGERPVASFRKVLYDKNKYYFDKANESYLKVEGHKRFNKSKKQFEYVKETVTTKKAVWNSWNPCVLINWEVVRNYVGEDRFDWFVEEVNSLIGTNATDLAFDDVRERLLSVNHAPLITQLNNLRLTGLGDYILDIKQGVKMTSKLKHTALNINNGVEKAIILKGQILVPVSDEDIEKIRNNKGCATILDGGMVWISSVVDGNKLSDEGFTKVSEISTEKY